MTTYYPGWDDRKLPLWSERVIAALPEGHAAHQEARDPVDRSGWPSRFSCSNAALDLRCSDSLAAKLDPFGTQRLLHQDVSVDRLMSLTGAGIGIYLMLEGATGARYDGVVYREVHDHDGPTRFNFAAYWRETNKNPTLTPFLDILRERYPDLSVVCAGLRSPPGSPSQIPDR